MSKVDPSVALSRRRFVSETLRLSAGVFLPLSALAYGQVPEPTPTPAPDLPATKVNPMDGAEMILIPAGEFLMGCQTGEEDERPTSGDCPFKLYLDAYYIYKYPVTVAMYRRYCEVTKQSMPLPKRRWKFEDGHPMTFMNYFEAKHYAEWAKGSLPTEAQWEKAARGTDGRHFPWGNDFNPSNLHWSQKGYGDAKKTCDVGTHPGGASPYGVQDMAGNVFHWTADFYDPRAYTLYTRIKKNPIGIQPPGGVVIEKVVRGGAWNLNKPEFFRTHNRASAVPTVRTEYFGFRVVVPAV